MTIDKIITDCIVMNIADVSGPKGATKVFPIDEQKTIFITMFEIIKRNGFVSEDITRTHRRKLLDSCCPKYKTGKDRQAWDFNSFLTLMSAEIAVFPSEYGPDAKEIDQDILEQSEERFRQIARELSIRFFEKAPTVEQENSEGSAYVENLDFFPNPTAVPLDPSHFKELPPDVVADDFSWLSGGIDK